MNWHTRTRSEGPRTTPPNQGEERATEGLLQMDVLFWVIKFHMEDIAVPGGRWMVTNCHILAKRDVALSSSSRWY